VGTTKTDPTRVRLAEVRLIEGVECCNEGWVGEPVTGIGENGGTVGLVHYRHGIADPLAAQEMRAIDREIAEPDVAYALRLGVAYRAGSRACLPMSSAAPRQCRGREVFDLVQRQPRHSLMLSRAAARLGVQNI
jgi:hypothetical protein